MATLKGDVCPAAHPDLNAAELKDAAKKLEELREQTLMVETFLGKRSVHIELGADGKISQIISSLNMPGASHALCIENVAKQFENYADMNVQKLFSSPIKPNLSTLRHWAKSLKYLHGLPVMQSGGENKKMKSIDKMKLEELEAFLMHYVKEGKKVFIGMDEYLINKNASSSSSHAIHVAESGFGDIGFGKKRNFRR